MRATNCMVCGKPNPSGRIVVYAKSLLDEDRGEQGRGVGVVCSSHTVWEIISDPSDRFMLDLWIEDGSVGGTA